VICFAGLKICCYFVELSILIKITDYELFQRTIIGVGAPYNHVVRRLYDAASFL
jgi:hypothetical protein